MTLKTKRCEEVRECEYSVHGKVEVVHREMPEVAFARKLVVSF